jgi:hypothetical protein
MNRDPASKTVFKFLDAKLLVSRIKPSPAQLIAHNTALSRGLVAHYIIGAELKTFTFASGTQSVYRQRHTRPASKTNSNHQGQE